ncbi:MAG: hypothetical protein ABIT71_21740 [Vicinamibacteraceae bacterium]
MSDPRDVAHDKKVAQEKKHHGEAAAPAGTPAVQPGKKPAAADKRTDPAGTAIALEPDEAADGNAVAPAGHAASVTPAVHEGSLVVLSKLKELEFHSRASIERLAELTLTVGDELKQQAFVAPLDELYSAQSAVQTKLTSLLEAYKAEVGRSD